MIKSFKLSIKYYLSKGEGFTLLELTIAAFVIVTGLVATANLVSYSISAVIVGKSQIVAANLAQEGLEVIRNIRDNNWHCIADPDCPLTGNPLTGNENDWKDGLVPPSFNCTTGCQVEYNSLKDDLDDLLIYADEPLKFYNEFYQYSVGFEEDKTRFKRKIIITDIGDEIRAVSEITWSERGRSYSIDAEDRLYNWK